MVGDSDPTYLTMFDTAEKYTYQWVRIEVGGLLVPVSVFLQTP